MGKGQNFLKGIFIYFGESCRGGLYLGGGIRKYLLSPMRGERS